MELPLRCIVCGVKPDPAFPPDPEFPQDYDWQPHGATTFTADGQYGSTVWDPITRRDKLMINICDSCLVQRKQFVGVWPEPIARRPEILPLVPWEPTDWDV